MINKKDFDKSTGKVKMVKKSEAAGKKQSKMVKKANKKATSSKSRKHQHKGKSSRQASEASVISDAIESASASQD